MRLQKYLFVGGLIAVGLLVLVRSLSTNWSKPVVRSYNQPFQAVEEYRWTMFDGALPGDFPPVPVYPGSEFMSGHKKVGDGKVGYEAAWKANGDALAVIAYYVQALKDAGWTVTVDDEYGYNPGEQFIEIVKNDVRATVVIEAEDEYVEVVFEFPAQAGLL
jgi:hypothetical protein